MIASLAALVKQTYAAPPTTCNEFSLEKWLDTNLIRYYSLGRYALVESLKLLEVGVGDYVALPEFICRDLLASVASVNATPCFYPVDEKLQLSGSSKKLAQAKAIVVVNYFGFPQDLRPYEEIAKKTGAVLIEDNAHGLFSCDEQGYPLGSRAPLGIFSLRKSLPLVNGAALVVNDLAYEKSIPDQLTSTSRSMPLDFRFKQFLRKSVPAVGIKPCLAMKNYSRLFRKIRTGQFMPESCDENEIRIPISPEPHAQLLEKSLQIDVVVEITRRRELYMILEEEILRYGGVPVFHQLTQGVSPYVFPFRIQDNLIGDLRKELEKIGLECHRWPDLPSEILALKKSHYDNIWTVLLRW